MEAKYGGLEAADVKRLKKLEHEPRRLKSMYDKLSLENQELQERHHKKALPLGERRTLAAHFGARFAFHGWPI